MTAEDNPELPPIEQFLAFEERVWKALMTGDAEIDKDMLSPGFLGVYPSGFSDRDGHAGQLENGPAVSDYALSDVQLLPIGRDHAMLVYTATYSRSGRSSSEKMYVSSLWERQGRRWRNTFSQDTPATDD